jgi:predicted transcriptional regulator
MSMTTPVDRSRLVETLKNLGLTKYEALVYIGLLGVQSGTATEIHQLSGVPRASVYPALNRLIRKNLVSISHTSPRRYQASAPEVGIDHLLGRMEENAGEAKTALREIHHKPVRREPGEEELIWSIYGKERIIDRLIDLIEPAKQEVRLIAQWDLLKDGIADALLGLPAKVSVEVICDRWEYGRHPNLTVFQLPFPPSLHDSVPPNNMAGVFIIDEKQVLVSMGSSEETPNALLSESAGFVQFFSRYYRFIIDWRERQVQ